MRAKQRYIAVGGGVLVLLGVWMLLGKEDEGPSHNGEPFFWAWGPDRPHAPSFMGADDFRYDQDLTLSARHRREVHSHTVHKKKCTMESCFDYSLCRNGFYVYVYPIEEPISEQYQSILTAVKNTRFYTTDPKKACIYILSLDTLDRDIGSAAYVKNVPEKLSKLEYWRGGKNHIIFNLYSGTWPDYNEDDVGFDIGKAMLAKASASESYFREGFDISFPLFHKEHAAKGGEKGQLAANTVPPVRRYTLVFKGKRYLTGIGSETRNSLYHLHNDQDIILLTTCKHGRGWKKLEDERCPKDNEEYEKHDYKILLHNSTFCLVPRGRRLGSYRFLETLQAACIPVLLSNGIVMPFHEVIDWNRAAVWGDERLLLQVPSIVRSIPHSEILLLRQQTQLLWETYFSSLDKIVTTTLEILKDRVLTYRSRSSYVWNSVPGALFYQPEYSDALAQYPFYYVPLGIDPDLHFTAVIYATTQAGKASDPIYRLVKNVLKSKWVTKIIILWHHETLPPPSASKIPVQHHVPIVVKPIKHLSDRFYPHPEIETSAVWCLDEDALLQPDEFDFSMSVWQYFPDRIVGFPARVHYFDESKGHWSYTSKRTNDYSMVLTGAAVIHKYYLFMYTNYLNLELRQTVNQLNNCEDILMNFLVSDISKYPPIKLTQRKAYKDSMVNPSSTINKATGGTAKWQTADHFAQRQTCLNSFVDWYGFMPLIKSNLRIDPVLFKDPVSIARKKYRQIEAIV